MTFENIKEKYGIIVYNNLNCYNRRIRLGFKKEKTYIIKACLEKKTGNQKQCSSFKKRD